MRSFPLIAAAVLICCLPAARASAQQLGCSPCSHAFGGASVGATSTFTFQLANTGAVTLRISSKAIQGAGFSMGTFPVPKKLPPGASVQLTLTFAPTTVGYSAGTVTLKSSDPHSPLTLNFHGHGVKAGGQLALSPASINFGNVVLGSSATLQVTAAASGAAVTISSDGSNSSEFAITGLALPVTLRPGQTMPVTIQFTPNTSGSASGKVGFYSNAVNSPTVEQTAGTGVAQGAHSVTLTWNPGDQNARGYNIYRSTNSSGPFQPINSTLDPSTNYIDTTVASGQTYYYVCTEVNNQGQESGYSNETTAAIPSP